MICKLLLVDPACAIRLSRRKVLFSDLKYLNMTLLKKGSALQQSDSSKQRQRENSQICHLPPAASKEVVSGPRTLKAAPRALHCNLAYIKVYRLPHPPGQKLAKYCKIGSEISANC